MKKTAVLFLLLSGLYTASAQTNSVCVDLPSNLSRGNESSHVFTLQQFLYAKGFLKTAPVGYFGPATLAAVKQYQTSVALPSTGNVFTLTRARIKQDSCAVTTNPASQAASSSTSITIYQKPFITNLDKGTLFVNATSSWSVVIQGTGFSTSSNSVYFKNLGNGRKYLIGTFPAENNSIITLPTDITKKVFSCGNDCFEALPAANYDISVQTEGGESNTVYTNVRSFSMSSMTGSPSSAIRQPATGVRLGTVTFSASVPFYVSNLSLSSETPGIQGGAGITNLVLKDELTGQTITSYDSSNSISPYQSKIIGIYGDIDSHQPGYFYGTVTVNITDYIGSKPVTFVLPTFVSTIAGL